jgi:hypothetical protein
MIVNIWVKVVYAAVVAFLSAIISALQAGGLDLVGWLVAVLAALVAGGGVLGLGNVSDPVKLQSAADKAAQKAGTFRVESMPAR